MKETLVEGIVHQATYSVTETLTTGHVGIPVLSTPGMIGLMENACAIATGTHLDRDEVTVGTHVCVSHVAASRLGETVTVDCCLVKKENRRLTFEVRAATVDRLLGEGTHQRAVINLGRFD